MTTKGWVAGAALALLAMATGAPAKAAGFPLEPGQSITVARSADGIWRVTAIARVESATPGQYAPNVKVPEGVTPPVVTPEARNKPAPPPDAVRFTLKAVGDVGGEQLIVENGYSGTFSYKASIWRGARGGPTSVCVVKHAVRSFEQWPFEFDRIEVDDFDLLPADAEMICR